MKAAVPTVQFLLKRKVTVIVISHRGRPEGFDKKLSLKKDAGELQKLLKKPVYFIPHFKFAEIEKIVRDAEPGSVFLLENMRFLPGEEKNDPKLAASLARLADAYVNDAFAVSHRADASVVAIAKLLPSYAGLELEKEIKCMGHALERPKRPLVIIAAGGKAHDKLEVIENFKTKADAFLMGGAAANTLLSLKGMDVGSSLVDKDQKDLKKLHKVLGYPNIILPVDFARGNGAILDIGPKSIKIFISKIKSARTIVWSGPLGLIEKKSYEYGTLEIAKAIAGNTRAFSLTGGGETVMFLKKHRLDKKFTFISTGGGAMLDFLAGKKLPGIEALRR